MAMPKGISPAKRTILVNMLGIRLYWCAGYRAQHVWGAGGDPKRPTFDQALWLEREGYVARKNEDWRGWEWILTPKGRKEAKR